MSNGDIYNMAMRITDHGGIHRGGSVLNGIWTYMRIMESHVHVMCI